MYFGHRIGSAIPRSVQPCPPGSTFVRTALFRSSCGARHSQECSILSIRFNLCENRHTFSIFIITVRLQRTIAYLVLFLCSLIYSQASHCCGAPVADEHTWSHVSWERGLLALIDTTRAGRLRSQARVFPLPEERLWYQCEPTASKTSSAPARARVGAARLECLDERHPFPPILPGAGIVDHGRRSSDRRRCAADHWFRHGTQRSVRFAGGDAITPATGRNHFGVGCPAALAGIAHPSARVGARNGHQRRRWRHYRGVVERANGAGCV